MTTSKFAVALLCSALSFGGVAFAQDTTPPAATDSGMSHDSMAPKAKMQDGMSKNSMSHGTMSHNSMSRSSMAHNSMKKDSAMSPNAMAPKHDAMSQPN